MSVFTIKGAAVVTDVLRVTNVVVSDGKIAAIGDDVCGDVTDGSGLYLMPGFIDTHVHGANGINFDHPSKPCFDPALEYEAKNGVTSIACTTGTHLTTQQICDAFDHISREAARRTHGSKIVGIHGEGPCVSPIRKGAMNASCMVAPSPELFEEFCSHGGDLPKILTAAPELDGMSEAAAAALSHGALLSMGHTDATEEQARRGIDMGFTRVTHTMNGMRPFHHREPGVLGVALTSSRLMCELICDFVHLAPSAVRLVYAAKGAKGITLISDTGLAAGLAEEDFTFYGQKRHNKSGALVLDDGTIAGSLCTVKTGVQNLHSLGIPLTDIAVMASENPAKALGISHKTGSIRVGLAADLVLLDASLEPVKVYIDGQLQQT